MAWYFSHFAVCCEIAKMATVIRVSRFPHAQPRHVFAQRAAPVLSIFFSGPDNGRKSAVSDLKSVEAVPDIQPSSFIFQIESPQ